MRRKKGKAKDSMCKYQCLLMDPGLPDYGWRGCHLPDTVQRGHSNIKALPHLWKAIRHFISLSGTECSGACQDTMMFASYMGYTRLRTKTKWSVKLLYASLTCRELKITQVAWMLHWLREHFCSPGTERQTVAQEPQTLTWKIYNTFPSRQCSTSVLYTFPTRTCNRGFYIFALYS